MAGGEQGRAQRIALEHRERERREGRELGLDALGRERRSQRIAGRAARVRQEVEARGRVVGGEDAPCGVGTEAGEPALDEERGMREVARELRGGHPLTPALSPRRGERGRSRRWRKQQDVAQDAVDELRGALSAGRARLVHGGVDGSVLRDPVEVAHLVERDLHDLAQARNELLHRDAARAGDLGVERGLPPQDAEDELAQQILVGRRQVARELPDEGRRVAGVLEHAAQRLDRARAGRRGGRPLAAGHRGLSKRAGSAMERANSAPVTGFFPARCRRSSWSSVPSPAETTRTPPSSRSAPGSPAIPPG